VAADWRGRGYEVGRVAWSTASPHVAVAEGSASANGGGFGGRL
jgi:hypothetical protein